LGSDPTPRPRKRTELYRKWNREYFEIAHRLEQEQIRLKKRFWKLSPNLIREVAARLGVEALKRMGYEEFEALCRRLGLL